MCWVCLGFFCESLGLLPVGLLGGIGIVAAYLVWPAETSAPIAHNHPELDPDHPHLKEHGADHRHPIVIDDEHRHWPTQG